MHSIFENADTFLIQVPRKERSFSSFFSQIFFSFRLIISKISSKLLADSKRATPPKCKTSLSKSAETVIPTIPSERTIAVQNEIARDVHVNTDKLNTDSSFDSLVKSDDVAIDSSCDEHVSTDNEIVDLTSDSLLRADEEVAAINHMWCVYDEHVTMDYEPADVSCEIYVNDDEVITDSHVYNDYHNITVSLDDLPAFIKIPPDNYEVAETECGIVGIIVDPDYWDWLDLRPSSEVILPRDDGGTASAGIESGHGYGVDCDVDSKASPHSSCHSPVPGEMVSCLSRSFSDESLNNIFNDCDAIRKDYEELRGKSAFTVVLSKYLRDQGLYNFA